MVRKVQYPVPQIPGVGRFRKVGQMTHPTQRYATVAQWIASESIPFALDDPGAFDAAVATLIGSLGDTVDLLGFGEGLHGGEALLLLRNRLFQRLVEAHGYSAIAFESSFPRGLAINEYIAGRGPASYDEVRETGFSHNFGRIDANRELIEWMRQYNADPARCVELHFYGADSPTENYYADSPRQTLIFALDYLVALAGDAAADELARRERIVALFGADAEWEDPAVMMDPAKGIGLSPAATALRIETEDLIGTLQIRRPALVASGGAARFLEALQHAVVARQLLTYHAGLARESPQRIEDLLGIRDVVIADNLAYAVTRERERGKVLAFAHNTHLQRSIAEMQLGPELQRWWPAGAQLAQTLGARYAVIGSTVGVSEANGIGQPEADTLEARLTAAPGPARFIPTHQGQGLPTEEIAALPWRSSSVTNPSHYPLTSQCLADFDWLAVLDETGYWRGGPQFNVSVDRN